MNRPRRQRTAAAAVAALVLLLAGCVPDAGAGSSGPAKASSSGAVASGSSVLEPAAAPTLSTPSGPVPYDAPVEVSVAKGKLRDVTVMAKDGGDLAGAIGSEGTHWTSADTPLPGATYDVKATALDSNGSPHTLTGRFTVADVPKSQRLTLTVLPNDGQVVGVGAPVIVRFDQKVTDRAAVEKAMAVAASTTVTGAWHWINAQEVHFRPQQYWPSGTKVQVRLQLNGVHAGKDLWGGRNYVSGFTVGAAHVSHVDGKKHTMTVTVDGRTIGTWPVSLGKPSFATRTGTYIVLSKDKVRRMTSCSANITCDKSNPNWYDLPVPWSVRLTWSGTFAHAAPWSVANQGRANVSHGCINLSPAHGKTFFGMSRFGDVVTVVNTSRNASDLVRSGDPGMADWNESWSAYVAGSALDRSVQTEPLAG
jgi:lipoprotein-anchoring transpeptidase ErfK/SrfK